VIAAGVTFLRVSVEPTPLYHELVQRDRFLQLVKNELDRLPGRFRSRIQNVAVLVEDLPPAQIASQSARRPRSLPPRKLVLGVYRGIPATRRSVFDLPAGPDTIVLYQKNIEAVCSSEDEIREQVRRTVIHELGHYFGMDEDQLRDV
jgi:predicted Zn-dependent protease with MMP-like domain